MRAYRPGRMSGEESEVRQVVRQERIRLYQERAKAGLPLFDVAGRDSAATSGVFFEPAKR